MLDRFNRNINYLRISVTDRCNFRCTYCMPAEGLAWLPREELLTFEELTRLLGLFVGRDQVCRGHVHAGGQLPHVQVVDVGDPFHVGEGGDDFLRLGHEGDRFWMEKV